MVPCRGRLPRLFSRHLLSVLLFDPRHGTALFLLRYQTVIWLLKHNMSSWQRHLHPWHLKRHFTDLWLIWSSKSRSRRADRVAKHRATRGSSVGQWLDRQQKKVYICFEDDSKLNLCQLGLINGCTLCPCQIIWVWGCSLQILFYISKRERGEWQSTFATIKHICALEERCEHMK